MSTKGRWLYPCAQRTVQLLACLLPLLLAQVVSAQNVTFAPTIGYTFKIGSEVDRSNLPIVVGTIAVDPISTTITGVTCQIGGNSFQISQSNQPYNLAQGDGIADCILEYTGGAPTGINTIQLNGIGIYGPANYTVFNYAATYYVAVYPTFVGAPYSFSLAPRQSVVLGTVRATDHEGDATDYAVDNPLYAFDAAGEGILSYIGPGTGSSDDPQELIVTATLGNGPLDVITTVVQLDFPHYTRFADTQGYTFILAEGNAASTSAPIFIDDIYPLDSSGFDAGCAFPDQIDSTTDPEAFGTLNPDSYNIDSTRRFLIADYAGTCSLYYIGDAVPANASNITVPIIAERGNREFSADFTIRTISKDPDIKMFNLNQSDNVNNYSEVGNDGSGVIRSGVIELGDLDFMNDVNVSYSIISISGSVINRFSIGHTGVLSYVSDVGEVQDSSLEIFAEKGQDAIVFDVQIAVHGIEFLPGQGYTFSLASSANGGPAPHILIGTIQATDALGNVSPSRNYYHFFNGRDSADDLLVGYNASRDLYIDPTGEYGLRSDANGVGLLYYIGGGTRQTTALTVIARTGYNDNRLTFAVFDIGLLGINFDQVDSIFSLSRGTDGTQPVLLTTLNATDEGGEGVTYGISADNSLFSVAASSGALYYIGSVPSAGPYIHRFDGIFYAFAGNSNVIGQRFGGNAFAVVWLNDQAPEFTQSRYEFDLDARTSGTPDAIVIGTVVASDGNFDRLSYSISSGNSDDKFSMDVDSGVLSYVGGGATLSADLFDYRLEINVSDLPTNPAAPAEAHAAAIGVAININALQLVDPNEVYAFNLDQGFDARVTPIVLGTIRATDINGDSFSFSVIVQNPDQVIGEEFNSFRTDLDGVLRYHGSGAFSSVPCAQSSDLQCIVLDVSVLTEAALPDIEKNKRSLQTEVTVVLQNESAPDFTTGDNYQFSLEANAVDTIILGTINATDSNGDTVSYSLNIFGSDRFSIGATSGIVSYASTESAVVGGFQGVIIVSDHVGNVNQANVTIMVLGLRAGQSGYTFVLDQNVSGPLAAPIGTIDVINPTESYIQFTLKETDRTRFSISNDEPTAMDVNGVVWYIGNGEMVNTVLDISINGSGQQYLPLDVDIVVRNTLLPAFEEDSYTFRINAASDGTVNPVAFGTVLATDPNGDEVTYAISNNALIAIGENDGILSYTGSGEASNTYITLEINASDGITDHTVVSVPLTVEFIGLQFNTSYVFSLNKGVPGTTVLGTVAAIDPTSGSTTISYTISDTDSFAIASVNNNQGVVSYIGDGESDPLFLTLTATAADGRDTTTAILIALDNNSSPEFLASSYQFVLHANDRGTPTAVVIGAVRATDANQEPVYYRIGCDLNNDSFSYQVTCHGGARFAITTFVDTTTNDYYGVLYYTGEGEAVGAQTSHIFVKAHDTDTSGVPVNETARPISIGVVSLQFLMPETEFDLPKGLAGPVVLGTFTAETPVSDQITYTIDDTTRFSMGPADGVLSYIGSGETNAVGIALVVTATDGDDRQTTLAITVSVSNHAAPTFQGLPYSFSLRDEDHGSPVAVIVGTVSAIDPNGDTVTYSIVFAEAHFSIDANNGILSYISTGERPGDILSVSIQASDGVNDATPVEVEIVVYSEIPRHTIMVQQSLAQAGTNITVNTVDVLGSRFVAAPHVIISSYSLDAQQAQHLKNLTQLPYWQQIGDWDGSESEFSLGTRFLEKWDEFRDKLVSGTSFLIPLSARRGSQLVTDSRFALWGQGRISGYTKDQHSGTVVSGYLGFDYTLPDALFPHDRLLFGLAIAQSQLDGESQVSGSDAKIDITATINTL